MSELDLGLKVAARRLLWRMGYSTRIDVPLRAYGSSPAPGVASAESYTDLDVLGVTLVPGGSVGTAIVDCKTGGSSAISRMFWVRGLVDFFGASSAYVVRDREISSGARQLASRLDLTALTGSEVAALEQLHPSSLPLGAEPLSNLFSEKHVAAVMQRYAEQDKKLKSLLEYRQFDYWIYDEHLNPVQMVEHLRGVRRTLDGQNPQHVAILLDCAWLYLLTMTHAIDQIRRVHVSNVALGLKEYLLGGPARVHEKENIATLLGELQAAGELPDTVSVDPLPSYTTAMAELLNRIMRRGDRVVDSLRYLEYVSSATMVSAKTSAAEGFGVNYDPIAAKIAENVVAFLVQSAELDGKLLVAARALLVKPADSPVTDQASPTSPTDQLDLGLSPQA
ncbi:hypothetical protein PFZ49_11775 [Microbacterium lacticum]|uniref:hypothetical protein n=1 Tax=Microbacterium lacticum TaxID=33885 RepID=UPI003A88C729